MATVAPTVAPSGLLVKDQKSEYKDDDDDEEGMAGRVLLFTV